MLNRLRVGIAGYGVVGKRRRYFIDSHPLCSTVAVCDQTFKEEGVMLDGVRYHQNYEQLLQEKLDVLFVCLSNDMAAKVTIAGLESGMHTFCEKPPGRNPEEVIRVIECEKKHSDLKLKYGFNHRYHDSVKDALQIIEENSLGKVINMRGVYGKSKIVTFDQTDWRTHRNIAGGGVLLDQGIHMVDLLRLFGGEFVEVHSYINNSFWNYDVEDNAYALMKTAENVVALFHSSATEWRHRFRLEVALERGNIILSGLLSGSKSYGAETMTVVYGNPEHDQGDPKEQMTRYNEDPSWHDEVFEFVDAVINNKPIIDGSSEDALRTIQLVYEIYCADKEWKKNL